MICVLLGVGLTLVMVLCMVPVTGVFADVNPAAVRSAAVSEKAALSAPKIKTDVKVTAKPVTVSWNKVSGATGYRIYQKDGDGWIVLADTTNLTYTVKTLKAGTKYTFAVRAYMINSGKRTFAPKYKTIDVTTKLTSLGVTSKITATQTTSSVTLKWNKVAGATHKKTNKFLRFNAPIRTLLLKRRAGIPRPL